jgi:hypothetical protein
VPLRLIVLSHTSTAFTLHSFKDPYSTKMAPFTTAFLFPLLALPVNILALPQASVFDPSLCNPNAAMLPTKPMLKMLWVALLYSDGAVVRKVSSYIGHAVKFENTNLTLLHSMLHNPLGDSYPIDSSCQ